MSALSFSGLLVQTLVQTGEGVGVKPCNIGVSESSLSGLGPGSRRFKSFRPDCECPLTAFVNGSFLLTGHQRASAPAVAMA